MNNIQKQFLQAIENNDIKNVKLLLNHPKVNPSDKDNWAIRYASIEGHYDIIKLLLNNNRVNPAAINNWAIRYASIEGHYDIVKLLLNDHRVNPADLNNLAIIYSSMGGHYHIVNLLWQNKRVKNSLKKDNKELYNQLIKKDKVEIF